MNRSRGVESGLAVIFFATGISGLGLQVIWAKWFSAGLGHEYPAVLAVVTAFMGGLALGAFVCGRWSGFQNPKAYGVLECVAGVWALGSTLLIPEANRWVMSRLGTEFSIGGQWALSFGAIFLVLLPATMAMGATLPALEQFVASLGGRREVALLYGANTAGAMVGAVGAAFWIMPRFGLLGGCLVLGGLNVMCGAGAVALARSGRGTPTLKEPAEESDRVLGLRLAVTGFLGIGFEAVMVRGLSQVLTNTVFTFAVILAVYLGGIALGSGLQRRARVRASWLLSGLAIACVLGGLGLKALPVLYARMREHFGDSLASVAAAEMLAAGVVLALPAVIMGATFACLAEDSLRARRDLSWSVAVNTAGGALAPGMVGLGLLPGAGLNGAIGLIALGYAALAGRWKSMVVAGGLAILALPFLPRSRDLLPLGAGERIVFHREGAMGTASVIENSIGARVLKVNNRFQMGGTAARLAEQRHADIPLLLHPDPRRALFIGLGTGITLRTVDFYPAVQAEGVELLPEVKAAMPFFTETNEVRRNWKVRVADGRRFVQSTSERYDVIVADLFHPAQDGAGFLYTREHFAAIRSRLDRNGLFCQWLPLFQMDLQTFRIIARTFMEVFPEGSAWLLRFNIDTPVIGLIAVMGKPNYDGQWVERRLGDRKLAEHLRQVALADSVRLFGCRLTGPEELRAYGADAPMNTDLRPVVMFRAPALVADKEADAAARLLELVARFDPGKAARSLGLREPALAKRVEDFMKARDAFLTGLSLETRGELVAAGARYIASVRESADFTQAYAQALAVATAQARSNPRFAEGLLRELAEARPEIPVAGTLLERLLGR